MALIAEEVRDIDVTPPGSDVSGTTDGGDLTDDRLMHAFQESMQQGSVLPLLKEELKYRIQARRLSEGKEELISAWEPARFYPLTNEERKKIMERKDRNKVSAIRHRQKRKEYLEELQQRYWMAQKKNDELQTEIRKLREKFQSEDKQDAQKAKQASSVRKKYKKATSTVSNSSAGAKYSNCNFSTSGQKRATETVTKPMDGQPVTPATETVTISNASLAATPATVTIKNSTGSQTETLPGDLKRKIPTAGGEELSAMPPAHKLVKVHVRPGGPRYVVMSVPVSTVSLSVEPSLITQEQTVTAAHTLELHTVATGGDARIISSPILPHSTLVCTTAGSSSFATVQSATQQDFVKVVMPGIQSRGTSNATASRRLPTSTPPTFSSSSSVQTKMSSSTAIPGAVVSQLPGGGFTFPLQHRVLLQGVTFPDVDSDAIIGVQLQTI